MVLEKISRRFLPIKHAKPVVGFVPYFKKRPPLKLENFLGPLMFPRTQDLGIIHFKKDPCVEASLTLLAICNFRESSLSVLPKRYCQDDLRSDVQRAAVHQRKSTGKQRHQRYRLGASAFI